MKTKTILSSIICFFAVLYVSAQTNYIDFNKCNITISDVKIIPEIKTFDYGILKAEKRSNQLVVIKLTGKTYIKGTQLVMPASFGITMYYRDQYQMVLSKAIGIKGSDGKGGVYELYWAAPDATMKCDLDANEDFSIYVVAEIPKDLKQFNVSIPAMLSKFAKI